MIPKGYKTDEKGVTTFLYDPYELSEWYEQGFKNGNVGYILYKMDDKSHTYLIFGTIENPSKSLTEMTLMNNPLYDRHLSTEPEDYIKERPTLPEDCFRNCKMVILEMG